MEPIGIVEMRDRGHVFPRREGKLVRLVRRPQIKALFALDDEGPVYCRLLLPYTREGWQQADEEEKRMMIAYARRQFMDFGVSGLAWPWFSGPPAGEWGLPVFDGSGFVAALAVILSWHLVKTVCVNRIHLVGHHPLILEILDLLTDLNRPVILESLCPQQSEVDLYRLLYERGTPAAVTSYNPSSWREDDLALVFMSQLLPRCRMSRSRVVDLSPSSQGLSWQLDEMLSAQSVDCRLGYLAPVMEAYVRGEGVCRENPRDSIINTLIAGAESGVWELFLDKPPIGLYNSLKGSAGYLG